MERYARGTVSVDARSQRTTKAALASFSRGVSAAAMTMKMAETHTKPTSWRGLRPTMSMRPRPMKSA